MADDKRRDHSLEHRLVVELDGAVHHQLENAASDLARDAGLRDNGWTVLGFRKRRSLAATRQRP